jgi:hypothetical protein
MKFAGSQGERAVCVFFALQLASMVKHVKCDHTLVLISAYRERHPFHTLPEMDFEIAFAAARFCQSVKSKLLLRLGKHIKGRFFTGD